MEIPPELNHLTNYPWEKKALAELLEILGEENVLLWYKTNDRSLKKCLEKSGFEKKKLKKVSHILLGYILNNSKALDYFPNLLEKDEVCYRALRLLATENFREKYEKSPTTIKTKLKMEKFGINVDVLDNPFIFYKTDLDLKPYGRDLRRKILSKLDTPKRLKRMVGGKEKLVEMPFEKVEKIAKKMRMYEELDELLFDHSLEFSVWSRDPKDDLFIGNYATTCIATGRENFEKVFKFLKDPGSIIFKIKLDGNTISYLRGYPCMYKNKRIFYLDFYDVHLDFKDYISIIKEYAISAVLLHAKKSNFDYLASGGFKLHEIDAYKREIEKFNRSLTKFGFSENSIMTEDYPEVKYLIRIS